jgi:Skp family chaperone for outer membrane proteins
MIKLFKPALAAGLAVAAIAAPAALAPAAAQQVAGIGVVNPQAVIVNSTAFRTAQQQRPVTYKPQIDQATARREAIAAQLQPLYEKLQADSQAPNAAQNQAALQQQYAQIQQIEGTGERELNQILAPVQLSVAYVEEQLTDQLPAAIQAAATKKNVSLVLSPEGVLYGAAPYNMNQDVLAELNTLLPTAQLVPPQGWLPREMREQQEAQAQAAAAQQPAASTTQPVSGR